MACYTVKEAKELWDYAKEKYLRVPGPHGYPDFRELTNNLSRDIKVKTGRLIVPEEIANLLSTPKRVRAANRDLLMAARNRAMMLNQAKRFVNGTQHSPLTRFAIGAYNAPYAAKVFGHAAALHMTHAWPYALEPRMWKNFGKSWVNAWKSMKESNARAVSQEIMLGSTFDEKMRSGLAADPRKMYDDLQRQMGFWGKLGRLSENSFLGLKQLRSMAWDVVWDTVPEHLRTDEMRKIISVGVNHMSGAPGPDAARALSGTMGTTARVLAFAPSLDVARVSRFADFAKWAGVAGKTALNKAPLAGDQLARLWGRATPEQQWYANYQMKQYARMASVATTLLFLNQMVLKHLFGSDENINWNDIDSPDWMTLKGPDGSILQATGGQVPMARMVSRMVRHPKQAPDVLGNYLLGKLNPFLNTAMTLAKGWGFGGTDVPMPFGEAPPTFTNWTEFLLAELGPISTEDGIHKFAGEMSDQSGIPQEFNEKFLRALVKGGLAIVPAALGMHYYKPTTSSRASKSDKNIIISSP